MTVEEEKDFLGALDQHWDNYRKQFKAGRREIIEESVHDLRVAARRFLALLSILRYLDSHPRVGKVRRFLKGQLDQLDQLHDTQVMLVEATQRLESLPTLAPFKTYLERRNRALTYAASKVVRASKPSDLKDRVKRFRAIAKQHSGSAKLRDRLLQAVDDAHSNVVQAFDALDPRDPATIHHVRVRFKKFRYMIETIQPLVKNYPADDLERMHKYQEAMGKVHDTTLFLDRLKEFEKRHAPGSHGGPSPLDTAAVRDFYQKRLDELIQAYFARKDEFHTFWRSAPDQSFPWEKSHDPLHRTPRNRRTARQQQQRTGRQPATVNRRRAQENAADREGAAGDGGTDRSDPQQPLPSGG